MADVPARVYLPPGYDRSTSKYPVLYMLELGDDFLFAAAVADFLARSGRAVATTVAGGMP